jgi:hypothetical protein
LNVAAIELSVLVRQCRNRRIDTLEEMRSETTAWQDQRNSMQARIDWHFTTEDASIKLMRLYPTLDT